MEIGRYLETIFLMTLFVRYSSSNLSHYKIVKTSLGTFNGTRATFNNCTVNQFLGVPYAKPPVGELRFKKPEPLEPSNSTYFANKMPPACVQYKEGPFPWNDLEGGKSEDCLYLNIWAPDHYCRNVPVFFWMYGGGFTFGSNRLRTYDGRALAAVGDIVVVVINYRVGVFGFLTSGTEEAPGNYGLYDMLEALKWVNQNIAAFGGDPSQVTIAGQSAGSIAASLFCVSPLTKGLFHRVIMESGASTYLLSDNSSSANLAMSQKLAEAVGCANDTNTISDNPEAVVNCLREKNATELAKVFNSFDPLATFSFFPQYGDKILPENARQEIINGNFHKVDVLIGINHDELSFVITTSNPDKFGFFGDKNFRVNKTYGETLLRGGIFTDFPDKDAFIHYYLAGVNDEDYDRIRYQVYTARSDYVHLCPTVFFAESYGEAGNDVHYYFFTHRPSTTPWADWMGVVHFDEVQFVFGLPLQEPENYTPEEKKLSSKMVEIWTNFIKSGSTGVSDWPSYSKEKHTYMELNTEKERKFGEGPHEDNCDFFRPYFGFQKK